MHSAITIMRYFFFSWLTVILFFGMPAHAQQPVPPMIAVAADAYTMWDRWPLQHFGDRAYMRSTYDRSGGNEGADASHFLFMNAEDENVTLDVAGRGILYFFRANHWHGSPWHFRVDGKDHLVRETATADPVDATKKLDTTVFIPSSPFAQPLAYTWSTTKGADLIWTPIPFKKSLQIAYSRTHYGTGYYIYHLYGDDSRLSRPIRSWNMHRPAERAVLKLIDSAGTDIAPRNIKKISGSLALKGQDTLLLADIRAPRSVIRAFKLTIPLEDAIKLERLRIRITWDGAAHPSVDAPLCLFFGAGTLYNRDKKQYLVKGFPLNIRYDYQQGKITLACYYPMPFFRSARFEITGAPPGGAAIDYEIRYMPWPFPAAWSSYFHGTYRDFPHPAAGHDLILLDTKGTEGENLWSGSFVGTSFIFSHQGVLNTLEGDPRFFFDDSQTPQAYGTGTEEWGGGGDYWGGQNMTLPFAGHPCGAVSKDKAENKLDLIESAYRFLLADMMPFGRRAVIRLEHGGENLSKEHYETVTYWYGLPAATLIRTDSIDVGNAASEKAHQYDSPEASGTAVLTSRYEWGIESLPSRPAKGTAAAGSGEEIYPPQQEDGRHTRGTTVFSATVDPANFGVLLRRTLDYGYANQKAKVYVADEGAGRARWKYAGIWYLAGSNTCVYSNPRGELDGRTYHVETSDRRLRDDEFLLPSALTRGLKRIKVKLSFIPSDQPLYPGMDFPVKGAWSALKYDVFSYVMPAFNTVR